MIFVDTGAWFAAFVSNDEDHLIADQWLLSNSVSLVTTDYVVDELVTLLKMRKETKRCLSIGNKLINGELAEVVFTSEEDIKNAWNIFCKYQDKQWSFTDCVSKAVMDRLKIKTAFSFDNHFRQFGNIKVVP